MFSPKASVLNEPRYFASPIRTITLYWSPCLSTARTFAGMGSFVAFLRLTSPEMGPSSKFQARRGTRGGERVGDTHGCSQRSRTYSQNEVGFFRSVAPRFFRIDYYLHWVITNVDSRPDVVELVKKFLGIPRDIFSVCAQTVANFYAEASKMDVTTLSKEDALRYQQTMDVTRRMQAVLDNDKGKGSPRAQEALRALMASWASNIAAMCAAPLYGLLCVPGVPWCPRSGRIGGGVLLSTCGTRKVPQS